ncbi:MAG: hypothetical protein JXA95_12220 [Spirochaetales bacterium]|nr:hypothetical protein [Spirochaetales bacterium]
MSNGNQVLIFVHKGNSGYLKYVLTQARVTNPQARIILIGDNSNNCYDFIEHHNISDYSGLSDNFEQNYYIHMSHHRYEYEAFCYFRWYVIAEYIQKEEIENFWYMDSDVLLFTNLSDYRKRFSINCDFIGHSQVIGSFNPSINYYVRDFLFKMIGYIDNSYKNNDILSKLESQWNHFKKYDIPGGVCDMTQIGMFFNSEESIQYECEDAYALHRNHNFVPDGQINIKENYTSAGECYQLGILSPGKKLIIRNKDAYGLLADGTKIQFVSSHFQGRAKDYIRRFYYLYQKKIFLFVLDIVVLLPVERISRFILKVFKKMRKLIFKKSVL